VHRFALFLTGDAARADDLTADTFVRAWRARDRIQHATVKAYLLAIARNLFRDQLRSSRQSTSREVELQDTIADEAPGADLHVQHASTLRDVRRGCAAWPRRPSGAAPLRAQGDVVRRGGRGAGISIGAVEVAHQPGARGAGGVDAAARNGEGR
jgi:hypothetical protein